MDESARPAVEVNPPPRAVLKVANAVLRRGLQSPLHRAIGKDLMLLHVRGRKTGRIYVVPVGRHRYKGQLVTSAGGAWRRNLEGGADLEVTLDGRRRPAHGDLLVDPQEVAEVFRTLLAEVGIKRAYTLGLKLNVDRLPTLDELRSALTDRKILRLRLLDEAASPGSS